MVNSGLITFLVLSFVFHSKPKKTWPARCKFKVRKRVRGQALYTKQGSFGATIFVCDEAYMFSCLKITIHGYRTVHMWHNEVLKDRSSGSSGEPNARSTCALLRCLMALGASRVFIFGRFMFIKHIFSP